MPEVFDETTQNSPVQTKREKSLRMAARDIESDYKHNHNSPILKKYFTLLYGSPCRLSYSPLEVTYLATQGCSSLIFREACVISTTAL